MNHNRDIEDYIGDYLNGSLTSEEEKKLTDWIQSARGNSDLFAGYCVLWELSATINSSNKFNEKKGWKKLAFRIDPGLRYQLLLREYGRIAAIFFLAFSLGLAAFKFFNSGNLTDSGTSWIVNEIPLGSKSMVTLPDGSEVWINAGSTIRYATNFNVSERIFFLDGEAYFKVVTNQDKPFVVNASGICITATGTEFNVRAYPEEDFIETTLVRGKVMVNSADASEKEAVLVKPNQKLTLFKKEDAKPVPVNEKIKHESEKIRTKSIPQISEARINSDIETVIYTSWKDKEWVIHKETLASLAVKLERRYDVKVTFNDEKIRDFTYSGRLKDETLEQVMNLICQTSPILYRVEGKNVNIWYNDNYNK